MRGCTTTKFYGGGELIVFLFFDYLFLVGQRESSENTIKIVNTTQKATDVFAAGLFNYYLFVFFRRGGGVQYWFCVLCAIMNMCHSDTQNIKIRRRLLKTRILTFHGLARSEMMPDSIVHIYALLVTRVLPCVTSCSFFFRTCCLSHL